MTCHDARGLFSALVDAALAGAERTTLDAHLDGCAECRRELDRFRSTLALLRAVEPARAPAGFVDRVLAAAPPAPWPRRLLRHLFLPLPVKLPVEAAAIVLVGVGVAYVFTGTPDLRQAARLEPTPPAMTRAPAAPAPKTSAAPSAEAKKKEARREVPGGAEKAVAARRDEAPPVSGADRPAEASSRLAEQLPVGRSAETEPAPEPEPRASALRAQQVPSAAARDAVARHAEQPADISGRLAVDDRETVLRALAALVARVNGRAVSGEPTPEATALEVVIPRETYGEFVGELRRLGRWLPDHEPRELPAEVRVTLRITG